MAFKSKSIDQLNQDIQIVKTIVNSVYGVDISRRVRIREYTEARRIYYKLLRDEGYSYPQIAHNSPMLVDHTTVIHHVQKIEGFLEIYPAIRRKYQTCLDMFLESKGEDLRIVSAPARATITEMNIKLQHLEEQLSLCRQNNALLRESNERFEETIQYLSVNVPEGKEDVALKRIQAMFNTIGNKW